jgi:GTP-binding protein HflX
MIPELLKEFPDSLPMSALSSDDISKLREWIINHFEKEMIDTDILIPYNRGELRGEVHRVMRVLAESHEEGGTKMSVRAPQGMIDSLMGKIRKS